MSGYVLLKRYTSHSYFVHFIFPPEDHWCSIDLLEVEMDSVDEFLLRADANLAEHGARHLAEKVFHQVEP